MVDEALRSELTAPGPRYRRAVELFDDQFIFHMRSRLGDTGAALGDILERSSTETELRDAIVLRSLCEFNEEARAAQQVLTLSPADRLKRSQDLFTARLQGCLEANPKNPVAACEQLLLEGLGDTDLRAAIVYLHVCYFMEALGKGPSLTAPPARN